MIIMMVITLLATGTVYRGLPVHTRAVVMLTVLHTEAVMMLLKVTGDRQGVHMGLRPQKLGRQGAA